MENGHEPATKQDLAQLRSELKQDAAQLRSELKQDAVQLRSELKQDAAQLRSEMGHIHQDLAERMERSETNLLKAFYAYAESNNKRVGQIEGTISGFFNRLNTLESRVLEVEKRLNIPPTA